MASRLRYEYGPGDFDKGMTTIADPIAEAATAAIGDVGLAAKLGGRANIAAAGFSTKWQNAYRLLLFPKGRVSINASAYLFHNIPYSAVFESGAVIRGKPRLWIPLKSAPKKIGGKRTTPKNYIAAVGPLFPIVRPGKAMLLAAKARVPRTFTFGTNVTVAQLRRGKQTTGRGRTVSIPLFFAVSAVTLRKRFNIAGTTQVAAAALPERFATRLKVN